MSHPYIEQIETVPAAAPSNGVASNVYQRLRQGACTVYCLDFLNTNFSGSGTGTPGTITLYDTDSETEPAADSDVKEFTFYAQRNDSNGYKIAGAGLLFKRGWQSKPVPQTGTLLYNSMAHRPDEWTSKAL